MGLTIKRTGEEGFANILEGIFFSDRLRYENLNIEN